jgi:hypothetical protein
MTLRFSTPPPPEPARVDASGDETEMDDDDSG